MRVVRVVAALWLAAFCAAALAQTQVLPDFTRLVEEQGNAVVNISTTQAARRTALPQVPGKNFCAQIGVWRPSTQEFLVADPITSPGNNCGTRSTVSMVWGLNNGSYLDDIPLTIGTADGSFKC